MTMDNNLAKTGCIVLMVSFISTCSVCRGDGNDIPESRNYVAGENSPEKKPEESVDQWRIKKSYDIKKTTDELIEESDENYPPMPGYYTCKKWFDIGFETHVAGKDLKIEEDARWTLLMLRLKLIHDQFLRYEKAPNLQVRYSARLRQFLESLDHEMVSWVPTGGMASAQDIFFIGGCRTDLGNFDRKHLRDSIEETELNRSERTGREVWDCIVDMWLLQGTPPSSLSALSGDNGCWRKGVFITEVETGEPAGYRMGYTKDGGKMLAFDMGNIKIEIHSERVSAKNSSASDDEGLDP